MALAALLAQPHPQPAVLGEHVLDLHAQGGADAGEGIDYERDQDAGAQVHREAQAARFNNDLRAIAVELRLIEQDWPAPTIEPPPKPPAGHPTPPPSVREMATRDVT